MRGYSTGELSRLNPHKLVDLFCREKITNKIKGTLFAYQFTKLERNPLLSCQSGCEEMTGIVPVKKSHVWFINFMD